jgi:Arc/MetJ-type ribon-helix-helix transcriptional regulator
MSIDLSPDIWNEIQRQVATGVFATPDDVFREALAALRVREGEVSAIQEAIDEMEAGLGRPFREFDREFRVRNGLPAAE